MAFLGLCHRRAGGVYPPTRLPQYLATPHLVAIALQLSDG
jgi:hypothetical protein